jgi:glycosyltransferase involved in cell wall biosynthesis
MFEKKIKLAICICTWNRAEMLKSTLESISNLDLPEDLKSNWEVLVVDNNSPDNTKQITARFEPIIPIRYEFMGTPGKSNALNHALSTLDAQFIAFTDDDVRLPKNWISQYWGAIKQADEKIAFWGAGVTPWFEKEPNQEMANALPSVRTGFCGINLPENVLITDSNCKALPVGANCVFRYEAIKDRRFDTKLGPNGTSHVTSEEWKMMRELIATGYRGQWVRDNEVLHYVPSTRLTLKYLFRFYKGLGCAEALNNTECDSRRVFGVPIWLVKMLVVSIGRCSIGFATRNHFKFYTQFAKASSIIGRIEGYRRIACVNRK